MARRCIKCWNKVLDNPILLSDDFDGCFCQNCYRQSSEEINTFLSLLASFYDAETEGEAAELFDEIEDSADNLGLDEEGREFLFTYLDRKMAEVQADIDQDVDEVAREVQSAKDQERRRHFETHKHQLRREFIAVTSNSIEGYQITAYHGIVTGTSVLGTGFFSEHKAMWSDFFGTESRAFSSKMEQAKDSALEYAIENAMLAGGNAMIAVDIDYTMFGSNMIAAVANGTAVTIEKK